MKCDVTDSNISFLESLPVRGAWIEIEKSTETYETCLSLPVRGAWIEILATSYIRHILDGRSP